jgi:general secretion pathway protein C
MTSSQLKLGGRLGEFWTPLRFVIEVILAIVFALLLARIFWLVVEPGGAVSDVRPLPSAGLERAQAVKVTSDRVILARANPFSLTATPPLEISDAPETSLNLMLRGLRASGSDGGVAMIVLPEGDMGVFHTGDEILDNVFLSEIYADRVTLNKNGRIEALMMDRTGSLSVVTRPGEPRVKGDPLPANAMGSSPEAASFSRDMLLELSFEPVEGDGTLKGYVVGTYGNEAALEASGFEKDDLITKVDGVGVAEIGLSGLMDQMTSFDSMTLTVERGDPPKELDLRLEGAN